MGIPHEISMKMTLDLVSHEIPYHVLGYSWVDDSPVWTLLPMRSEGGLLLPSGAPVDVRLEEMGKVDLRTGPATYCVGRFDNGRHVPCPLHEVVSQFAQCPTCMGYDIPDPSCIFEPHCSSGTCGAEFCQIEHVVYLTGFRERTKVGMTQLRRVATRGREQGADVILPLLVLGDRYSARVMEWRISKLLGLPQSVPSNTKISGWARARDDRKISQRLLDLKGYLSRSWDRILGEIGPEVKVMKTPMEFDQGPIPLEYPLEEPLSTPPRRYRQDIVRGEVVGYKGNYLVFNANGTWVWRIGESPGRIVYFLEKLN
jgi:hypothetical protein